MAVSGKIKGLLSFTDRDYTGLASALGISVQSLGNKFYRGSFSAEDLIIVADYAGCDLAFLAPDGSKMILDMADIDPYRRFS